MGYYPRISPPRAVDSRPRGGVGQRTPAFPRHARAPDGAPGVGPRRVYPAQSRSTGRTSGVLQDVGLDMFSFYIIIITLYEIYNINYYKLLLLLLKLPKSIIIILS